MGLAYYLLTVLVTGSCSRACPSEPRWTPSRRRAKGRLAQIGSTLVVFFSVAFGRVVWAKATMLHNYALATVWEVPCFRFTGGDGHARLTTGSW